MSRYLVFCDRQNVYSIYNGLGQCNGVFYSVICFVLKTNMNELDLRLPTGGFFLAPATATEGPFRPKCDITGRTGGRTVGRPDCSRDKQTAGHTKQTDKRTDLRTGEQMDKRTKGEMDGRTGGWMNTGLRELYKMDNQKQYLCTCYG